MKEREIRDILDRVCRNLDARAALGTAVVGASVAAATGCGGETESYPLYAAPLVDGGAEDVKADSQDADADEGMSVVYMGPPDAADEDTGAIPPYMAPDSGDEDSGPVPEYMGIIPDASDEDSGPVPPYMGVPPDAGDDEDAGPTPPYMAPDV